MPRPPRRAPAGADATTTPPRPGHTNAITAAIPPSMLETPPHLQTTPGGRRAHHVDQVGPENSRLRRRQRIDLLNSVQVPDTTPLNGGQAHEENIDQSHVSSQPLGSAESEQGDESLIDALHYNAEDVRALAGLREIGSLATWTLSSAKPGCALAQLRHPSTSYFWQSDGPQPHTLTLHFFKLVSIVKIRIYLDFDSDESYTPTQMRFFAGMSEGGLVEFGSWEVEDSVDPETGEMSQNVKKIKGWIYIPLTGVGGRDPQYYEKAEARKARAYEKRVLHAGNGDMMDVVENEEEEDDMAEGDVLRAMVLQVRVCENHQHGKDTHVRGFQVFAKDETVAKDMRKTVKRTKQDRGGKSRAEADVEEDELVGLQPAEWMGEPDLR